MFFILPWILALKRRCPHVHKFTFKYVFYYVDFLVNFHHIIKSFLINHDYQSIINYITNHITSRYCKNAYKLKSNR